MAVEVHGCTVTLRKIVSGGQTGVDRAALDVALARSITCGGWVPHGRRAEGGIVPARYPVRETRQPDYRHRTRRNVRCSDASLIITRGPPRGGTALTGAVARRLGRPLLVCDLERLTDPTRVRSWLARHRVKILNVAGPRESRAPGIGRQAAAFLDAVLG